SDQRCCGGLGARRGDCSRRLSGPAGGCRGRVGCHGGPAVLGGAAGTPAADRGALRREGASRRVRIVLRASQVCGPAAAGPDPRGRGAAATAREGGAAGAYAAVRQDRTQPDRTTATLRVGRETAAEAGP